MIISKTPLRISFVGGGSDNLINQKDFEGKGYGDFKAAVADVVVEYLRPIRARALELLEDEKHLLNILHQGSEKARSVASKTLETTYKNLGVVL